MPSSSCRKRRSARRRQHQQHHQPLLCWRNPFCVFLVSFLAIGSLRFRERKQRSIHATTSMRSQISARPLLRNNNNNNKGTEVASIMTTTTVAAELEYEKVQEGTTSVGNHNFIKYRVVDKTSRQAVSAYQWAQTIAGSHAKDNGGKPSANHKESAAAAALQFNQLLASAPYQAFYWETPPILRGNVDVDDDVDNDTASANSSRNKPMEFVLVDAPELYAFARNKPDASAFAEHFRSNSSSPASTSAATATAVAAAAAVAVFDNLGKDAKLVVPKPVKGSTSNKAYSDLAAFCRGATSSQIEIVWRTVSEQYLQQMHSSTTTTTAAAAATTTTEMRKPVVWLSTSGGGVAWLHFRFDSRPKYYTYKPYTTITAPAAGGAAAAGVVDNHFYQTNFHVASTR